MRYLVTGGAGFIGSHLVERLIARGDSVIVLDDLSTGREANIAHLEGAPCFRFELGTILDADLVGRLTEEAEVVVHLAAAVGVELIVERPLESLITNVHGTEIVLSAAAQHGKRFLLTSTSEIYGKNTGPLSEDADRILGSPLRSRWSYAAAKAVDEILAHAYWRERGTPTIIVRLFNTVGPRQTDDHGMVVPRFVRQALAGQDVTVFGDGGQRRSFCHVLDAVDAIVGLLDHPGAVGGVFNVGARNEITINELAERIIATAGSTSRIVRIPYDEAYEPGFEDMQRRVPDTTSIRGLTGWEATRGFDEIVADAIAFGRSTGGR